MDKNNKAWSSHPCLRTDGQAEILDSERDLAERHDPGQGFHQQHLPVLCVGGWNGIEVRQPGV